MHHRVALRLLPLVSIVVCTLAMGAPRRVVVISDTHWGVGKLAQRWHSTEDFRWSADFAAFLHHLLKSSSPTDLVVNGDMFELWQSALPDCRSEDPDLGCSEAEADQRLLRVLRAHTEEIAALRAFASSGDNRVIVVPGNHDAALLLSSVRNSLLNEIGLPAERFMIAATGVWRSEDGAVVAAHGHEADEFNTFAGWPEPFVDRAGVRYLRRPAGEQFVQEFFNAIENRYPIIDNIQEEAAALRYGLAAEGMRAPIVQAPRLVRLLLMRMSPKQQQVTLGTTDATMASDWDEEGIRSLGSAFFLHAIPSDDVLYPVMKRAIRQGRLTTAARKLTADDISTICRERGRVAAFDHRIAPCPTRTLGEAAGFVSDHSLEDVERFVRKIADTQTRIVVLSHTHTPREPFDVTTKDQTVLAVNTGAWQRTIPAADLVTFPTSWRTRRALRRQPDTLPACYPFVLVGFPGGRPNVGLRYWEGTKAGWREVAECR